MTGCTGDLDRVTELISGFGLAPEEESPYEALFEATSCHSLDSLTSGKSSDRDSGRPDSEVGKVSRTSRTQTQHSDGAPHRFVWEVQLIVSTRGSCSLCTKKNNKYLNNQEFIIKRLSAWNLPSNSFIHRKIVLPSRHILVLLMKKRWAQRWGHKVMTPSNNKDFSLLAPFLSSHRAHSKGEPSCWAFVSKMLTGCQKMIMPYWE